MTHAPSRTTGTACTAYMNTLQKAAAYSAKVSQTCSRPMATELSHCVR